VVVAIISLLSSVVMASLNSARAKARDAAAKQGARQLATLMQMDYDSSGSYANFNGSWVPHTSCDSNFSGTYATQARNICKNILSNAKTVWASPPGELGYALFVANTYGDPKRYSINVSLNNGKWYCTGSSGTTDNTYYWLSTIDGTDIQNYTPPATDRRSESPVGCYYNP
jgi:type II secretory pathway pseudopilin PulG